MSKYTRREHYWKMYFWCEGEKYTGKEHFGKWGLCVMCYKLRTSTLHSYPELQKVYLNTNIGWEPGGYWFPRNESGYNRRQAMLLKAIDLTHK